MNLIATGKCGEHRERKNDDNECHEQCDALHFRSPFRLPVFVAAMAIADYHNDTATRGVTEIPHCDAAPVRSVTPRGSTRAV